MTGIEKARLSVEIAKLIHSAESLAGYADEIGHHDAFYAAACIRDAETALHLAAARLKATIPSKG